MCHYFSHSGGDANSRFFHLWANGRRQKNFIQRLQKDNGWAFTHDDKHKLIEEHFEQIMGQPPPCTKDFSWSDLILPEVNLATLDAPFSEEEIWQAVKQMPREKAPSPDGFTGLFFRECWQTIRHDVLAEINSHYNMCCNDLNLCNKASIILLPKKEGAENIGDFRPISLIHAVAKIITKILALRLAPFIGNLISPCQSAFIKKHSIHDNFLYVRNLTRWFHRTKTPTLLLKLDISKAFDSVRWDYLLSLLQHLGFPLRWISWVAALLASSSSRVMLNGILLDTIQHGRGLRQGDPLSPLLFILVVDPLHRLLHVATERGCLSKLTGKGARFRASMYADDAVIFLKPTHGDVTNLKRLLLNFGAMTDLRTNQEKTNVTAIRCDNLDLDSILADFPVARAHFLLKYLGLPLTPRRLNRIDFQPLVDKALG
jgi:mannosylglycoprotein endo-beta-mannosidase